jgi:hypothetical protein
LKAFPPKTEVPIALNLDCKIEEAYNGAYQQRTYKWEERSDDITSDHEVTCLPIADSLLVNMRTIRAFREWCSKYAPFGEFQPSSENPAVKRIIASGSS